MKRVSDSLQRRIARFHLVDNTRGEPPFWSEMEVRDLDLKLEKGRLSGKVQLETVDGKRGYEADVLGIVEAKNGRITQFDIVARGDFWGAGPYTKNPPSGKFPLAVAFSLADGSEVADKIPPQASRGWIRGYLP